MNYHCANLYTTAWRNTDKTKFSPTFLRFFHKISLFCQKMSDLGYIKPYTWTCIIAYISCKVNVIEYPSAKFYTIRSSNNNIIKYFPIFHDFVKEFDYFFEMISIQFPHSNFSFLSSNIPSSPAYGVFISQLIRYARACSSYECFILRARRLSSKLLKQGYLVERLKS